MPLRRVDAETAECVVITQREGLLAAMGHDLLLRVTRFVIEGDAEVPSLDARFDAASLRVIAALRDGTPDPGALTESDRRTIEAAIVRDVLHARAHPEIRFTATAIEPAGDAYAVDGRLALHGTERPLAFRIVRAGEQWVAEVRIHQHDFGIRPYRALLGALAVKPDVRVRVTVPAVAVGAER
jgi:polyisoprenoid-binding protein YceI